MSNVFAITAAVGSTGQPSPPAETRVVEASAEQVWAVLADGWLYATWVVGASRIRMVDAHWPAAGSKIHHSVGLWPALIDDHTEVSTARPGQELVLKARAWPVGEARVRVTIDGLDEHRCRVSMIEDATAGPGRLIPRPLRQLAILPRNKESLLRLALLAERRSPSSPTVHSKHE